MALYRGTYRIESTRLPDWNYAVPGWYLPAVSRFARVVTLCTQDRRCCFGEVEDGSLVRTDLGDLARTCWEEIPLHNPNVVLDAFVVMPNHVHGIVGIPHREGEPQTLCRDVACYVSTETSANTKGFASISPQKGSLGTIIRSYEAAVTRMARRVGCADLAWQPRYFEHVIRSQRGLEAIRGYIRKNPEYWKGDSYFRQQ